MRENTRGRKPGRKLFITTLMCVLTFAVSGAAAAFKNIQVGDHAFPVELTDLEGRDHSLARYRETGSVLVLFWATWSERSLRELEDLTKLGSQYGDEGLQILAINVDNQSLGHEDMQKIRSTLLERGIELPVLIDDGLETYNEWGVIAVPATAIVEESGTIVFDLSSYPTSGYLDVDEAIRKTLGLHAEVEGPATAETGYKPARNAMLHFGLGKRHAEKGSLTKALPEFQKAAEADSRWADPRIYMGFLHLMEGQQDKARLSLELAGNLEKDREEVLLLRSYLLVKGQKVDEALALLQSKEFGVPRDDPQSLSAEPEPEVTGPPGEAKEPDAAPAGEAGLEGVRALTEEGRMEEASRQLEEIIARRLDEFGFVMKKMKKLSAMEKMKLMMEKKQEQQ
jgi:peroxiredoxin